MKKKIGIVVLWAACGVFNWGVTIGYFSGEFPNIPHRSHYGIAAFTAAAGPVGTISSFFMSNLYQHGFVWK
jgi:hypothetical protein